MKGTVVVLVLFLFLFDSFVESKYVDFYILLACNKVKFSFLDLLSC